MCVGRYPSEQEQLFVHYYPLRTGERRGGGGICKTIWL